MKYSEIFQKAHDLLLSGEERCCCGALHSTMFPAGAPFVGYKEFQYEKAIEILTKRHCPTGMNPGNFWWPLTSEGQISRLAALMDCRDYFLAVEASP